MGHYASEMGVDIPYDDFSKEAIEARKKDEADGRDTGVEASVLV